ncbi:MAG TPA: DMT family transporter [Candidatus Thermoplasmatota archaeon]|nr:DMT family transporter [Candidatus Thermoplasmatota archaeon]
MRKVAAWLGLGLAAAAGVLYGAITVASKAADAHPLAKGTVSALAAGVVLAPFLGGFRLEPDKRWHDGSRMATMSLLGGALAPALILHGLERTTAIHAGLLLTLELVVTGLLALLLLRERFTPRHGLGLLALLGAAVAVALAGQRTGASSASGLLLVGLAAVAFSLDNVVSTTLTGAYRPWHLIAVKVLGAAPLLGAAWLAAGGSGPERALDWGLLVGAGIAGLGGGSVLFYVALRSIGAARTAAIAMPTSGLAAAAGGVLLGEAVGWLDGVALVLVASGIGLLWQQGEVRAAKRS